MSLPPASRSSFELTSPHVAWRYEGLGRVIGHLALLPIAVPFVISTIGVVLSGALDDSSLDSVAFGALLFIPLGVLVAFGLALVSALLSTTAFGRKRLVRVVAGAAGLRLTLGAVERSIPRDEIRSGLVVSEPRVRVELHLRGGRVLEVQVAREKEGARLLAALGLGPAERRVEVSLGGVNRELVAGCVGMPVFMGYWLIVLGAISRPLFGHASLVVAWLVLTLASTWLLHRAVRRTRVVVGSDGVRVERPFSSVYIPYTELAAVRTRGDRLLLSHRRSEAAVALGTGEKLTDTLAERIREAHACAIGSEAPRGAEALERRGRDLAAWRDELRKLIAAGDYRATALSPEDVLHTLDDADSPPDRRIGAALLLRIAGYPEARGRIRVAAEATADDALRAALEHAAEEEVDDAALARALR
ncbi:hypothetical protein WMF04_39255 [Sorangium sp. So ce260]|uniref:PH domain-containing protein n=1 Tax=Sorangium sp. So ce260 TaxID=3133291 RepID=UPI003F63D04B